MTFANTSFLKFDHVQVAMPVGGEDTARAFYGDVLGMTEIEKPPALKVRGGCWFSGGHGAVEIHCGVEADFRPARKAHPAILTSDLAPLAQRLETAGHPVRWDHEIEGVERFSTEDPFGNRLEFVGAKVG